MVLKVIKKQLRFIGSHIWSFHKGVELLIVQKNKNINLELIRRGKKLIIYFVIAVGKQLIVELKVASKLFTVSLQL